MKIFSGGIFVLILAGVAGTAWPGEMIATVRDPQGRPVENAVILAMPLDRKALDAAKPARQDVVDQINKEFVPYVRVVFNGTSVSFPNKDNIRHHVYSFSAAKKFELPLYSGVPAAPVIFDKAGVVALGCNIHDWMIGYIYVAETPFFGKTDREGHAKLDNLPSGNYQVRLWHPDSETDEQATLQRIAIAEKPVNAAWKIALKPSFRIPRPTGSGSGSYR